MSKRTVILVQKRDGSLEDYDPGKIGKVVKAAGLDKKKTEKLLSLINKWVTGLKKNKVTSIQIRDRIIPELKKLDDYAYKKYVWWENYKDKHLNNR